MRAPATTGILLALAVLTACGETSTTDQRFATPERTVDTLLTAHGAGDTSADAIEARMASGEGLPIVDPEAYAGCFTDLGEPGGQALAEYVFGMIAASRDSLRYEAIARRGYVVLRSGDRVVMERGADGAYRIALRESVPDDVRRRIQGLAAP